jgi:hypothetical protein
MGANFFEAGNFNHGEKQPGFFIFEPFAPFGGRKSSVENFREL